MHRLSQSVSYNSPHMEALGGTLLPDFELQESQGILSTVMTEGEDQDEEKEDPSTLKQSEEKPPQIDILQFQNSFFECIEELKICRGKEAENDMKINQLVSAQHDYHQTINEEKSKTSALLEKHSEELCEQRRLHEENIHQLEAEKNKLTLASDCMVKEMKELKNDIKTLQLTKYSLEKTIKDQDQRLQMQGSVRSTHLSKMTELEILGKDILKQYNLVAEQLKKLEVNVKEAQELNSRLAFINKHQSCSSQSYKEDLKAKTDEIIRLKALLEGRPNLEEVAIKKAQSKLRQSEQQVKQKETQFRQLLEQLEAARTANKTSLEALARSQLLAERHLVSSEKNSELASSLSMTVGSLEREIFQLKEGLCTMEKELSLEKREREEFVTECQMQEESFKIKLRAKEADNQAVVKDREHLEELNSSWSKKNNDLIEEVEDLKKQLASNEERERNMPQKFNKSTNTESVLQEKVPQGFTSTEQNNSVQEANDPNNEVENPKEANKDDTSSKQRTEGPNIIATEKLICIKESKQVESKTTANGLCQVQGCPDRVESMVIHCEPADKQSGAQLQESLMACQAGESANCSVICEKDAESTSSITVTSTKGVDSLLAAASETEILIQDREVSSKGIADVVLRQPKEGVILQPVKHSLVNLEGAQMQSTLPLNSKEVLHHPDEEKPIEVAEQKAADETVTTLGGINKSEKQCFNVADISVASQGAGDQLSIGKSNTKAVPFNIGSIPPKDNNSKVAEETTVIKGCLKDTCTQNASAESSLKNDCLEAYPQASITNHLAPHEKMCLPIPNMSQLDSKELDSDGMQLASIQLRSNPLSTKNNNTDQEKLSENTKRTNWLPAILESSTRNTVAIDCNKSARRQSLSGSYSLGLINEASHAPHSLVSSAKAKVSSTLSGGNTSARITPKSTYVLPGFSLLTKSRHGVTVKPASCLNLPPSPQGMGKVGNLPAEKACHVKETSLLRKYQDSQNVPEKLPQTKAKENSQEWPNFAEEFDSEPNTEQVSIGDPGTTRPNPTQSLTTKSPDIGSKRPAEDREPLLFSDDDDGDVSDTTLDIARQINRIQRFLRNDRLKRPKRSSSSKEPVV